LRSFYQFSSSAAHFLNIRHRPPHSAVHPMPLAHFTSFTLSEIEGLVV
jgi:hypothetical protein